MYGDVFKIGMNATKFWLWVRPRVNTVWAGDRGGAWESRFIVAPKDLMVALGLFSVDLKPGQKAGFAVGDRHYVLSEDREFAGERVPMRSIWFDRQTLRPARVDLYDDRGHCVLMAELMKYERVGGVEVCTVYRARFFRGRFFGDDELDLVLRLSRPDLEKKLNPRLFEYVVPPGAVEKSLDELDAKSGM
jgi:hypothetical protein